MLKTRDGLLEQLPVGVCFCDLTGAFVRYNRRAAALWGLTEKAERSPAAIRGTIKFYDEHGHLLPTDGTPIHDVLATREPIRNREMIIERADGSRLTVLANIEPLLDETGAMIGAVECFTDVTESKRFESQQRTLIDELNHRVKNTLATVQSLASHSFGRADSDARLAFDGRLLALSRVHDQLSRRQWEAADLKTMLSDVLTRFDEGLDTRWRLAGETVSLPTKPALTLALVFHELASNAWRHGALQTGTGSLDVAWRGTRVKGRCALHLDWHERGGPLPPSPLKKGFGLRLVERGIQQDLGGTARMDFAATGLRFAMDVAFAA